MPSLVMRYEGQAIATANMTGDAFVLGRQNDCDLVVKDVLASRQHAAITKTDAGGVVLEDQGSHNGTLLNGQRIEREPLNDGDEIQIGSHVITFYLADEPPSATAASDPTAADVTGRGVKTFDEGEDDQLGDMLRGMLDQAKKSQGAGSDKTLPQGTQPAKPPDQEATVAAEPDAQAPAPPAPEAVARQGHSKSLMLILGGIVFVLILVFLIVAFLM